MSPSDTPQSLPMRFYKIASDTLRAAELGQFGADYTAQQLLDELNNNIKNVLPMFTADKTKDQFSLTSPDESQILALRDAAVVVYQSYIDAGRPALTN